MECSTGLYIYQSDSWLGNESSWHRWGCLPMTKANTEIEKQRSQSAPKRHKGSSRTALSSPRNIGWLGLTIISVSVFFAAARVSTSVRDVQARVAVLEQFGQGDSSPDLEVIRADIGAMRADLAVMRSDLGWLFPVLPAFSWLPRTGGAVAGS